MYKEKVVKASNMIQQYNKVQVLTGAGISTESGNPDFRSSQTGLWEKFDPIKTLSLPILINNPQHFYNVGYKLLLNMKNAKPNSGHFALAELEKLNLIDGIITQNIDNLHQRAGSKEILEVHGNTRTGSCISCNKEISLDVITEKIKKNQIPPICDVCKGILRPNVVLFGDRLPEDFNIARDRVRKSELLIVVGSSLTVTPVNFLPELAKRLIIINLEETPFDKHADIVIRGKLGKVLNEILDNINRREGK